MRSRVRGRMLVWSWIFAFIPSDFAIAFASSLWGGDCKICKRVPYHRPDTIFNSIQMLIVAFGRGHRTQTDMSSLSLEQMRSGANSMQPDLPHCLHR
jgi:hypothetical protein